MKYTNCINYLIVGLFIMAGCTNSIATEINYGDDSSWVAKPVTISKSADVFYVYPTIYVAKNPPNMDISDPQLRERAQGPLIGQAGVYSSYANVFAPFYRQQSADTQSMEPNNGGQDAFIDPLFLTGYHDVECAFDYYIKHLNPDRPFILAGHSQGSMVVIHLLRNRLQDPALQKRMVAAYSIGYTVKKGDLERYPWMKLAQGETDTGVIITFNTQGKNAKGSPVLLDDAVAINPLNWKSDGTPAPRNKNIEAVFFNNSTHEVLERIPHFAGAYIDTKTGALIATDIQTPKSDKIDFVNIGRWPAEVYHLFDYAFWYGNLKANVKKRIEAYHAAQKGK